MSAFLERKMERFISEQKDGYRFMAAEVSPRLNLSAKTISYMLKHDFPDVKCAGKTPQGGYIWQVCRCEEVRQ